MPVGGHNGVAQGQPALIGQEHQPHSPDEAVLGLGAAIAGKAGEPTPPLAAGIVSDHERCTVSQPDPTHLKEAGQLLLHDADKSHEAPQFAVVLGLIGPARKPTGQHAGPWPRRTKAGQLSYACPVRVPSLLLLLPPPAHDELTM